MAAVGPGARARPVNGARSIRIALYERWIDARNRVISNPRFQAWAADFPLTRAIARRRARALFDICAGFVYSQVLLAGVRVHLFDELAEGPRTLAAISVRIGLSPDATRRLLRAAASLKMVRDFGADRYGLDELGAALVGNPAISAMIEHNALLYRDLADPVGLLRGDVSTQLGRFWPYAVDSPGDAAASSRAPTEAFGAYSALMSATQPLVAEDILDAYDVGRRRCLLDVGGGEGGFLIAAAARAPRLKLQLFDLPPVAERAQRLMAQLGLSDRIEITGGSFLEDALPTGADLISIVRVLHDHDDPSALALLRAVHAALPPGGGLLVAEPMSGAKGAEPIGDAYFGFYLLAMGRGRARTASEIASLLRSAGFARVEPLRTRRPMLAGAILAVRT